MAQHIFIIGSKGIPGLYGGYETFVDKLTEYHQNCQEINYHVACKSTESGEFKYHNARCPHGRKFDFISTLEKCSLHNEGSSLSR